MRAMKDEPGDMNKKIANFLLSYRNMVHATTNETPAKLFLNRNLRTRLDLLKPNVTKQVKDSQMKKNYRAKDKWIPGVIQDRTGP